MPSGPWVLRDERHTRKKIPDFTVASHEINANTRMRVFDMYIIDPLDQIVLVRTGEGRKSCGKNPPSLYGTAINLNSKTFRAELDA